MRLIITLIALRDWLIDPPKRVVNTLIILGGIICIVATGYYTVIEDGIHLNYKWIHYNKDFTPHVIRELKGWTYHVHDAVWHIGGLLGEMIFLYVAKTKIKYKPATYFTDWYFELQLTDLFYLIWELFEPVDTAKNWTVTISFGLFLLSCLVRALNPKPNFNNRKKNR